MCVLEAPQGLHHWHQNANTYKQSTATLSFLPSKPAFALFRKVALKMSRKASAPSSLDVDNMCRLYWSLLGLGLEKKVFRSLRLFAISLGESVIMPHQLEHVCSLIETLEKERRTSYYLAWNHRVRLARISKYSTWDQDCLTILATSSVTLAMSL